MHPILFHVGPLTIYTYGVLVATGVLLGLWYARHEAPAAGLDPDRVWNLGIYMVLAALVSAKLWLVALYASYYWAHPREIIALSTLQSGGTFYGGLIGAFVVAALYTRHYKIPYLPLMDIYAPGLALGHAIGRLACFSAGCCWGKPTWLPWGVTFTNQTAAELVGTPLGVPLHPTQLYEAVAEAANFLVLVLLRRRQRFTGQLFATYLLLYGLERGSIEFLRGDPDRTMLFHGAFSLMQVVSLLMVLLGAWMWWRGLNPSGAAPAARVPAPVKR
jgi:phosphatidylglycerol:prolipoprotein diacylglycerol transferase